MPDYYVNDTAKIPGGGHEVHAKGCYRLDLAKSKTYLGEFTACHPAVVAANRKYPRSNGCAFCCPDCHTS